MGGHPGLQNGNRRNVWISNSCSLSLSLSPSLSPSLSVSVTGSFHAILDVHTNPDEAGCREYDGVEQVKRGFMQKVTHRLQFHIGAPMSQIRITGKVDEKASHSVCH